MKSLFAAMLIAFCTAAPALAAEVHLGESDQAAVRAVALAYARSWYAGDSAQMAGALHDRLAKRAYLKNKERKRELSELDKAGLVAGTRPENALRYAKAPRRAEVEILDGFGNVASVRLQMDEWVDYMHLVRAEDGEWRIINVLWEQGAP